ncbi:hypothetical protein C0991_008160 [Blastosporella zonata]|nr:hypothetical protein C0991_008160 [Blastosporella zonata]
MLQASELEALVHDVLAFRVEDLGWTALSIISISVVFIYSVSAAGDPRPMALSKVRPNNYLAQAKQRKAEIAAAIELEQSRTRIRQKWSTNGFHFRRLPPELQIIVLAYSADWPETYRALVLGSRYLYHSTLRACLPLMSITLNSTKQIASFASLVHKDGSSPHILPLAAGALVHRLWVSPRREDFMDAYHILRACTNVRALACDPRWLAMIMKSPRFKHTMCKDLTLLPTRPHWDNFMTTPCGIQLLRQLTHLRVMGESCVPQGVSFNMLLHLSYSVPLASNGQDDSALEKRPWMLSNRAAFPYLQQVVLTRQCGVEERAPLKVDARLVHIHLRKDHTEMEIWRNGLNGESLWQQAAKALPAPKKPTTATKS